MKYVVILEIPDTGYIDCIAICNNSEEAYGEAYLNLVDDIGDNFYITQPQETEGNNGFVIECVDMATKKTYETATVLFFDDTKKYESKGEF